MRPGCLYGPREVPIAAKDINIAMWEIAVHDSPPLLGGFGGRGKPLKGLK